MILADLTFQLSGVSAHRHQNELETIPGLYASKLDNSGSFTGGQDDDYNGNSISKFP